LRRQETLHQTLDFVPRDDNITKNLSENPTAEVSDASGHGDDRATHANGMLDFMDQLTVRECLRPDGIDNVGRTPGSLGHSDFSEVVYPPRSFRLRLFRA
jgi:hypothetical protein